MVTNPYEVKVAKSAYREMTKIYEYMAEDLFAEREATKWMELVEEKIKELENMPKMYPEIEPINGLEKYRKIVGKNYVILYWIDEENKTVYVSHIKYARRDYINNL